MSLKPILKQLASETFIYGLSSIAGRFLNWGLTPYYARLFLPADYGIVTNIYAYVALLLVMLTYGMETTFFRFANNQGNHFKTIYGTALWMLLTTSVLFAGGVVLGSSFLGTWLGGGQYGHWYVILMGLTVAIDAFTTMPFAYLRLQHKAWRFATLRLSNIALTIGLNIFFLSVCPVLYQQPQLSWFLSWYNPHFGVGYVFMANLIASVVVLLLTLPYFGCIKWPFSLKTLKSMIHYTWPMLLVGITGIMSLHIDKILMPLLISKQHNALEQLGIYGANFKLAALMTLFIQAFRYAFEPFLFAQANSKDALALYALIMRYFFILGLLIFLGVTSFLGVFKHIIAPAYYSGLKVVAPVLLGNFFWGVYFNQSAWYKLADKTIYGAYMSLLGVCLTILANVIAIPYMGYMGAAYGLLIAAVVQCVVSYLWGQRYYKIPYPVKRLTGYLAVALFLYWLNNYLNQHHNTMHFSLQGTLFVSTYVVFIAISEKWYKLLLPSSTSKTI